MPFWTEKALEPKRQYRFTLELGTFPDMKFMVKSVNKPAITIDAKTHNYLNHEFHYPGRPKWNEVEAKIIDAVAPDASYKLSDILLQAGYIVPKTSNQVTTISKAAAVDALGNVTIKQYGPSRSQTGLNEAPGIRPDNKGDAPGKATLPKWDSYGPDGVIETWTLNNPFITEINYGALDYAQEELVEIAIKFKYDWATIRAPDYENGNRQDIWK